MTKRLTGAVLAVGILCSWALASSPQASEIDEIALLVKDNWLYRTQTDDSTISSWFEAVRPFAGDNRRTAHAILTRLNDKHSYYIFPDGERLFSPSSPTQSTNECAPELLPQSSVPLGVAYLRISLSQQKSSEAITEEINERAAGATKGWILDLRASGGGNMWPALAGLGSLLGSGVAGYFVDADEVFTPWGYSSQGAWLASPESVLGAIAQERRRESKGRARIAVLTDRGVASSGEALAIAFRGRDETKSFGAPTCGLSTAVQVFRLQSGARLGLVVSRMADRTKVVYGGSVVPDERVTEQGEVVQRASEWLLR
jgi:hypothetical protein